MSAAGSGAAQAGTTLIEALAAVTLVGFVSMIAFPRLQQSLTAFSQRAAQSEVAARLRQARADAVRLNRPRLFEVADDGRGFGASGWPLTRTSAGVELSASGPITFYGDGSSSGGQVFVSAGRRTLGLAVQPSTGRVVEGGE
jgi:type II secretory pathway pseudopilin PulG